MGSAALYHLARRGKRVLGIERFDVPNDLGSSHGITRIIRLAHFEHPSYVPLVRRAYELWRELEDEVGEQLLHVTGAIDAGGELYEGSLRSCREWDLPHELLDGRELRPPLPRLPPARRPPRPAPTRRRLPHSRALHRAHARAARRSRRGAADGRACARVGGRCRTPFWCTSRAGRSRPTASCSPRARGHRRSLGSRPVSS